LKNLKIPTKKMSSFESLPKTTSTTTTTTIPFSTFLSNRCKSINSLLCVGLDPHIQDLSNITNTSTVEQKALAAELFCENVIQQTYPFAAAYKPNSAFFEALGWRGIAVLERIISKIPQDIPVLLDFKRGDINTTAEAYAQFAYDSSKASAVTINPYMGWDSVEPFVKDKTKGVFILCKTSNKSSEDFETLPISSSNNEPLYTVVAKKCVEWNQQCAKTTGENNYNNMGLVVGATDVKAMAIARSIAKEVWILSPGVGFQGGDLTQTIHAGLRLSDGLGILIPVSRAISRAKDPGMEAQRLRDLINIERMKIMSTSSTSSTTTTEQSPTKRTALMNEFNSPPNGLEVFQIDFFQLALSCGVLKFGSFTLKSGRTSPYFFNAGEFNTGKAAACLARCYAQAIVKSQIEFDVIFGPAYKGIPLAATIVAELYSTHGRDVPYAYNRKEAKDHGEGGNVVGAKINEKTRVLIVDDVITAGTAVRESVTLLQGLGAKIAGLVVAIDRQEITSSTTTTTTDNHNETSSTTNNNSNNGGPISIRKSAVDAVKEEFGFPVVSIVTLNHLLMYCTSRPDEVGGESVLKNIKEYRSKYGV
jgi:uridine monophosphate synthetase